MQHTNEVKEVLISEQQILERTAELGKQISKDYAGKKPLVVGILKGAWIFLADLARAIDIDVEIEFMSVSSYGTATTTSGSITLVKDLQVSVEGRDVIVVEDILDTGLTLSHLTELLMSRKASSVEIAALLSKPSRRKVEINAKYVGFEIPDNFVIGYGLDFAEKFRGLREVCILTEESYM